MIIILPSPPRRSLTLALRPPRLSDLEDVSRLIRASPSSHRHCSPLPVYSASCVYPPCITLCSLCRGAADMCGEQAERRLPLSRPYSVPHILTSQVLAGGRGEGEASPATLLSHHGSLSSATEGKTSPLLKRHCVTRPSEVAKRATREHLLGFSVSRVLIAARLVGNSSFPKGEGE